MRIVRGVSFAAVALAAAVVVPGAARAQDARSLTSSDAVEPTTVAVAGVAPAPTAGPRADLVRAGARALVGSASREPVPMRRADTPRSRMLMIVGGAAFVGGAIIGDDVGTIIMLGGLGVGLYGLYLHLK